MPDRNVAIPVPILEIVYAKGYIDDDKKSQVFSPITYRKLPRVKIVAFVRNVYKPKNGGAKAFRRVSLWDGYGITAVSFDPAHFDTIDNLKGEFAEIIARPRVNEMPDGTKRIDLFIESIAPGTPETFVLHKLLVMKAIEEKFGTTDPEELKKMVEKVEKWREKYSGKKLMAYIEKHGKDKKEVYKEIAETLEGLEYIELLETPEVVEEEEAEEEFEELE